MEFRILGPVELWAGGERHHIGWARERCVLAVLLVAPRRPVPTETLVECVWDDPPINARERLWPQIARLRTRLQNLGVRLSHQSGAYLLDIDPETTDYHRFRVLHAQARAVADSGDDTHALQLYQEASSLWRGEPLTGLSSEWADRTRRVIQDEGLACAYDRLDLELRLGRHAELIGELSDLVARRPLDDKPAELLMLALYRAGRKGEALEVHRTMQRRLATELGIDVAPELSELHRRILAADPTLMPPRASEKAPRNDLPRDLNTFTGRQEELRHLMEAAGNGTTAPVVLAIDGMPGVGKTALAIHLAYRLSSRYPDGQLIAELHGHDPAHPPVDPGAALEHLLRMLGVPAARIPRDLPGRSALWRAELARRRMLVVLDGARSHDQLYRLLPGAGNCLVIITSRRRLTGLDDVRTLSLEVMPPQDATALFTRIIGPRENLTDADAETVVRLCGHLPLAIQLVGNRFRHRTAWSGADLVARLAEDHRRLREIRAENREIAAAFDLSFRDLGPRQQHAFRVLGLSPGPDLTADAAAALLGIGREEADALLDGIVDHHLITEHRGGRYRYHDLIRMYAVQLAAELPETERDRAVGRLVQHYRKAADRAHRLVSGLAPDDLGAPGPGTFAEAQEWFEAELENVLAAAFYAADHAHPRETVAIARLLAGQLETSGRWEAAVRLHAEAAAMARRLSDEDALAAALTDLGLVVWRSGRSAEALQHVREALAIRERQGDSAAVATLHDQLGLVHWHRSEYDLARDYFERALQVRKALGDRHGEAESLNHLAIVSFHRSEYEQALDGHGQALAIYTELGDSRGRQMALNNLGEIMQRLGRHAEAMRLLEEAAAAQPDMSRQHRAIWLTNRGNALQGMGRLEEALESYRRALSSHRQIGDRRSEAETLNSVGWCYFRSGLFGEASAHFELAGQIGRAIGERFVEAESLRGMGAALRQSGRSSLALEKLAAALRIAHEIGDAYQKARVLEEVAHVIGHLQGDPAAETLRRRAQEIHDQPGIETAEVHTQLDQPADQ